MDTHVFLFILQLGISTWTRSTHVHYKTLWQLWIVAVAKREALLFVIFYDTMKNEKIKLHHKNSVKDV